MVKVCSQCKIEKDTKEFGVDYYRIDGLNPRCLKCNSINSSVWQKANRERQRKYQQAWRAKNKEKVADRLSTRVAKYPEQRKAQIAAYRAHGPALQYKCVRCDAQAQHWHHWSYEERYHTSVIPVCIKCHRAHHSGKLTPLLSAVEVII